ncbi:MAG: polymerase subunit gamma/tau [Actinomycetota bacterium]|nr:polymerase subunit gamma/tau [Actinomycetota bacterium]
MSTALYRRYRPETFAEVIGQEHVTRPLMAALSKNRVNHAYLFSGPRGCGKTTSARILARCLNCEQGPTPEPCGKCPSCIELARGGPGSLDVVEIDAASHGGVEDARSLRESAVFAPARDRFKVFILDEAHMVSPQGFNALLKIVEEPPPHVRFVFATTEPDKVIGTIRSRTHHYPFRLVPPERLREYLAELCAREEVPVEDSVLPLVVRAGAGSVRDSLSVLDQLMAGTGDEGLTYQLAVTLLGYTDATLLDSVVEALAAGDAATVFGVVEQVIETGHDPRRFVEDLLERLRDLVVMAAVQDGDHAVHRSLPADQRERMRAQAARFGRAELSRAADVVNAAFTEMTGATSPRLHLELLCARLLLPGADAGESGLGARMERLERRIAQGGLSSPAPVSDLPPAAAPPPVQPAHSPRTSRGSGPSRPPGAPAPSAVSQTRAAPAPVRNSALPPSEAPQGWQTPVAGADAQSSPPPGPPAAARGAATAGPPAGGGGGVDELRRLWPGILSTLAGVRRTTWSLVSHYAQVVDFDGRTVVLGFDSPGRAASFSRGAHQEVLRQILSQTLRIECALHVVSDGGPPTGPGGPGPGPSGPGPGSGPSGPPAGPVPGQGSSGGGGNQPAGPAPSPGPAPEGARPSATSWEPTAPSGSSGPVRPGEIPASVPVPNVPRPSGHPVAGAPEAPGTALGGRTTGGGGPDRAMHEVGVSRAVSPAPEEDIPPPDEPPARDEPEEQWRPVEPALTGADRVRAAAAGARSPERSGGPGSGSGNGSRREPRGGVGRPLGAFRDDEASRDDRDLEDSGLVGEQVVVRYLGGSVIAEQNS